MPRPSASADTAERILQVAEQLVQARGYNAFSYADIAQTLNLTKASLHYHFPTKADLGQRMIQRYRHYFSKALDEIDATCADVAEKLKRYIGLYLTVLRNDRMCLCGMLAAEVATLPKTMRAELKLFFDENEIWLSGILDAGRAALKCDFAGAARDAARHVIAALEGGMMLSRSYGDVARFEVSAERLLVELGIRA